MRIYEGPFGSLFLGVGQFSSRIKSLFRNSERSSHSVFAADFRAGRVCMAERCDFGREALDWLCKEGRACLKSNNPVVEVGSLCLLNIIMLQAG